MSFLIRSKIEYRFTKEKLWFLESDRDPKRTVLSSTYKSLFQNKQMVCIEYSELTPELEREIFQVCVTLSL